VRRCSAAGKKASWNAIRHSARHAWAPRPVESQEATEYDAKQAGFSMQQIPRRTLLKGVGAAPLLFPANGWAQGNDQTPARGENPATPNMIGAYGQWAADAMQDPPRLSFRQPMFSDAAAWSPAARAQFRERLMPPGGAAAPVPVVMQQLEFDGLSIEHLQWQLPFGPPTEALFLKPAGAKGKLPGIVGLHDHGGQKYFGMRKITRTAKDQHPVMQAHQERYYGGACLGERTSSARATPCWCTTRSPSEAGVFGSPTCRRVSATVWWKSTPTPRKRSSATTSSQRITSI